MNALIVDKDRLKEFINRVVKNEKEVEEVINKLAFLDETRRKKSPQMLDLGTIDVHEWLDHKKVDVLTVRVGNHWKFIAIGDILFLKSEGNYTKIICRKLNGRDNVTLCDEKLGKVVDKLPKEKFITINRGRVVNIDYIDKMHRITHQKYEISLKAEMEGRVKVSKHRITDVRKKLKLS